MKKINYLFFCLFLSVAFLASCGSDDGGGGPTAEEAALAKLQGTWDLTAANKDNSPITGYESMTLTIANKTMTATGTPESDSVFPTGSFSFVGDNYNQILVDGIKVTLAVTETKLVTSFSLNEDGSDAGRVAVVQGDYQFTFDKAE